MYPYRQTGDVKTTFESYRTNKAMLLEREWVRDVENNGDTFLFIELWGY